MPGSREVWMRPQDKAERMITHIGDNARCPNCNGVAPYHNLPCSGAYGWSMPPLPAPFGHAPAPVMDAHQVRLIVGEELAGVRKQMETLRSSIAHLETKFMQVGGL